MMKVWILALAVWGTAFAMQSSYVNAAEKKDDVFLDEGDGDFDALPSVPAAAAEPVTEPAKADAPKAVATTKEKKKKNKKEKTAAAAPVAAPAPAPEAAPTEQVQALDLGDEPAAIADVPPDAQVEPVGAPAQTAPAEQAAAAPAPAPAKEPKQPKQPKQAKQAKGEKPLAHGLFVTTKEACAMTREPASESAKMITVKAEKRIWVEEVDASYVRGYNKAGEAGFISRDCLK